MTVVDLGAGTGVTYPRRLRLRRDELDLLGRLVDVDVPRVGPPDVVRPTDHVARRLAGAAPVARAPRADADVCQGLHQQGLVDVPDLSRARVDDELATALRVLHAPEVHVALDVAVTQPRPVALHAVHRVRGSWLATLASVDGERHELGWTETSLWSAELARGATVNSSPRLPASPPGAVDLPYELLLGGTAAVRERRDDLLAQVVAIHTGSLSVEGQVVTDAEAADVLRRLENGTVARLQALPAGAAGVGLVSWLGFSDGWRALVPVTDSPDQLVRVRRREPADLASDVARVLASAVPGGSDDRHGDAA